MAKWNFTVDVKDLWKKNQTEDFDTKMPVKEFCAELHTVLSFYRPKFEKLDMEAFMEFEDLLFDLSINEFQSYDDFDEWWRMMYDLCDDYKVWIATF